MDRSSLPLPFDEGPDVLARRDERARRAATDPRRNVVLEASAGTGKTTVLVNRYLNLLKAGVDPTNILAITFTRKAAAEMRQRIVHELQTAAMLSSADAARWHDLRDRLGDIGISTIDAFCLSLLREFPLEAELDPGFEIADETLVARMKEDALDRTLAVCRRVGTKDETVRLLLALLGEGKLRRAVGRLLERRVVARGVLRRFASGAPFSPARPVRGDCHAPCRDPVGDSRRARWVPAGRPADGPAISARRTRSREHGGLRQGPGAQRRRSGGCRRTAGGARRHPRLFHHPGRRAAQEAPECLSSARVSVARGVPAARSGPGGDRARRPPPAGRVRS